MPPWTETLIDRTPQRVRRPVTVLVRTGERAAADRLPGLASEMAFWVLLSLPALLLTAIAALSLVAGEGGGWRDDLVDRIVEVATVALTPNAIDNVLRPVLERLVEDTTLPVVSLAFLTTVWTASRAVKVVLVTIALTYGDQEPGGIARRLLAFALTFGALVVGLLLAPLLVVSAALRLYGTWILGTDSPYGPLAGPIVGLLWVWLTGFVVLLGAELNAQIEWMWPTRPAGPHASRGTDAMRRLTGPLSSRLR